MRAVIRAWPAAGLVLATVAAAAQFHGWSVECVEGSSTCRVESEAAEEGQVRFERGGVGLPLEWSLVLAAAAELRELKLAVDEHPTLALSADDLERDGQELLLADQEAKYRLLGDLRRGRVLKVAWTLRDGGDGSFRVSLAGLADALRYLDAQQASAQAAGEPAAGLRSVLACEAGLPAWVLEFDGPRLELASPGDSQVQRLEGELHEVADARPATLLWRGQGRGGDLVAVLRREPCGEAQAEYSLLLSSADQVVRSGCCRRQEWLEPRVSERAEPSKNAPPDWTRDFDALLPAMRACLDWSPSGSVVLQAWPVDAERVGVRTRVLDGPERVECRISRDGETLEMIDTLDTTAPVREGEGRPLFYPAELTPPDCARPARLNSGEQVGWLADAECTGGS